MAEDIQDFTRKSIITHKLTKYKPQNSFPLQEHTLYSLPPYGGGLGRGSSMIQLSNISKIFGTDEVQTTALNGVSLEIKQGEFIAIMGPSGCGKSTLLNILGLIDTPSEGSYLLNGKDVSKMGESERTDLRKGFMGFIFQNFNLIDDLNVNENVELPLIYMGIPKKEREQMVLDILRSVNMSQRGKHLPSQLSGGQQQRVAIARALVGLKADKCNYSPSLQTGGDQGVGLLLADEPTGNLDSKNGLEVMEMLKELNEQGTTIIMVTHSQHDATYADRIINLYDGQVVDNVDGLL